MIDLQQSIKIRESVRNEAIEQLFLPGIRMCFAFLLMCSVTSVFGQHLNQDGLYGQTGIVTTPNAGLQQDGKLTVGWQAIPAAQAHLEFSRKNNVGEKVYFARLGFLPWAEASIRLVHPNNAKNGSYGIGDRSIFLKFRALKERKYWPALAIGVYDPIGTKLLPASYMVASKSFSISERWMVQATSGYGFEFFKDVEYLVSGFWAGCQILPSRPPASLWPQWTAGAEIHMNKINLQAGLTAFSILQVNAYLLDLQDLALSVSASIRL